jgi:hypothetical protein
VSEDHGHGSGFEAYTNRTQFEKALASMVVGFIFAVAQAVKSIFVLLFNIIKALI